MIANNTTLGAMLTSVYQVLPLLRALPNKLSKESQLTRSLSGSISSPFETR